MNKTIWKYITELRKEGRGGVLEGNGEALERGGVWEGGTEVRRESLEWGTYGSVKEVVVVDGATQGNGKRGKEKL